MGRIRSFTRSILGFYFGSLWPALRGTWKWTAPTATALGLAIPLYLHFAKLTPAGEAAMTSLIWQIPAMLFGSLLLMLVIYTPFSKYQALERTAIAKDKEIKRLEEARRKDAERLEQERQQTKYFQDYWTEGKGQIAELTKEIDLLKSESNKRLDSEKRKQLLALQKEGNDFHEACNSNSGKCTEERVKDWETRVGDLLRENLSEEHRAMFSTRQFNRREFGGFSHTLTR